MSIYHNYSDADYDMHHNNADAKPYLYGLTTACGGQLLALRC